MIVKTLKKASAVAMILATATVANANVLGIERFHVGVDIMHTTLNWNKGDDMERTVLPKNPTAFGLYTGANLYAHNEFGAGLEFGVEYMQKNKKTIIHEQGMIVHEGIPYVEALSVDLNAKLKSWTPYLGITGNYKINQNFKLTSMVGAGIMITKMKVDARTTVQLNDQIIASSDNNDAATFKKNAFVPMARVGAQYDFNANFGIRTNVGYRYLKGVKATLQTAHLDDNNNGHTLVAKKHSFNFGVGAVVSF